MSWLTLLLAVLLPAGVPSSPAPSAPRHAVAAPVRAQPRREFASASVSVAKLTSADRQGSQVASRRLSARRTHPIADALLPGHLPPAPPVVTRGASVDTQSAAPGAAPASLLRYARIIYPVPPPLV